MLEKLSSSGENAYGDQEKDANSLLMELDKGIAVGDLKRSTLT